MSTAASWEAVIEKITAASTDARVWRDAFLAIPRDCFVPATIWQTNPDGAGYVSVSKADDPDRWWELVRSDSYVVTQVDDGVTAPEQVGRRISSSSSMPAVMAVMLGALQAQDGDRILEIGTGTGYNTALLCHRLGDSMVTSVEIDPTVADHARKALAATGYAPAVITADGTEGDAEHAPYDRVLATVAVTEVPYAWIAQTHHGGTVVTPWGTRLLNSSLLRMTVAADGTASGHFVDHAAFMRLRAQRLGDWLPRPGEHPDAVESTTSLHPYYPIGDDEGAAFAVSVLLPELEKSIAYHDADHTDYELLIFHEESRSWASVAVNSSSSRSGRFPVRQHGPRTLWDEIEAAHAWWVEHGRPCYTQFGLTVTATGQFVWLEHPDQPVIQTVGPGV